MEIRKLVREDVTVSVKVKSDDMSDIDMLIDDEGLRNAIKADAEDGNIWAWADVELTVTWKDFSGVVTLSACSYESEAEFLQDNDHLIEEAIEELNEKLEEALKDLKSLAVLKYRQVSSDF